MDLLTTHQAGKILGVTYGRIHQLITWGELPAKKFGRQWIVDKDDLKAYKKRRRPVGRPRIIK